LPFDCHLSTGLPIYEQILFSVKKAIISGQLKPGDHFPSIRVLSRELKINPNTAQKTVTALQNAGLLEVAPGIGTVVAKLQGASPAPHVQNWLNHACENLVVEAKTYALSLNDVVNAIQNHWMK
jgi:GntR family transcriptional regulator